MTNRKIVIAYFVIVSNLIAQWAWQSPAPQGNNLNDVKIINANTVIAVGNLGTVLKSTDAGETWTHIYLGTEMNFNSVHFADENTGYVLGTEGTIFKTTDKGETWTVLSIGIKIAYHSICFVNKDIGYACGYYGYIMKTTDGGETWERKNSKTINTLNKIYFINPSLGFAIGKEGTIAKTTDDGTTWKGISVDPSAELKSIFFVDENTGWTVSSNGKIFNTTDGGTTWSQQYSNSTAKFSCVWFSDESNGLAFGSVTHVTNNGGKTWSQKNAVGGIISVDIRKGKLGFTVGGYGGIRKTEDGGTTWKTLTSGSVGELSSVFFINPNIGWAGGSWSRKHYKSSNGGNTWEPMILTEFLTKIYFRDENNGFAFGYDVFKTSNGGAKWDSIYPSDSRIRSAAIIGDNIWFVNESGNVYKSLDDGKTWEVFTIENIKNLWAIFFIDKQKGWAVAPQGIILNSVDGGKTWVQQKNIIHWGLQAVSFSDENNGWVCGDLGYILHTTNGGDTWNEQKTGTTVVLTAIQFINKQLGWVVGWNGTILKTTNGGENWIQQKSNTTIDLYTVFFLDETTGWAAGANGTILKTTNGGTTFIEEEKEIPTEFELSQNYPNPFNPETTISYKLASPSTNRSGVQAASHVSLKVYDVLGREVATLVNEYKQPGTYKATFNTRHAERSRSIHSGVYFYRLQVGNPSTGSGQGFIQAKKMVLLK